VKRYGKEGFTRKVIEYLDLEGQMRKWMESLGVEPFPMGYYRGDATAEQLIKVAEMIPRANLRDRQNDAPNFEAFLEVARREPRAIFELYVIPEARADERVTVDGALVPVDRQDLVEFLKGKAKAEPDEFGEVEVGGAKYVRLWWD
jgi:hypothetical protein